MNTNALPAEPEWLTKSRMAYWKDHREGRLVPFCFVCARQAAEKYFFRKILGRNPRKPLSLDVPGYDGGSPPHEWLDATSLARDEPLNLDWLSDEVLEGVLFEARQAAGFSQRMLTRYWDTIQTDKVLLR